MKKAITLSILSALSIAVLSGCGASTPSPAEHKHSIGSGGSVSGATHTGIINKEHMTQKKVQHLIKKAGEDAGWRMTEFKTNAIIAEKILDNDATVITVTFDRYSYDLEPHNNELDDAIYNIVK